MQAEALRYLKLAGRCFRIFLSGAAPVCGRKEKGKRNGSARG